MSRSTKVRFCHRCRYSWRPSDKRRPVRCPNCRSKSWAFPVSYSKMGVSA